MNNKKQTDVERMDQALGIEYGKAQQAGQSAQSAAQQAGQSAQSAAQHNRQNGFLGQDNIQANRRANEMATARAQQAQVYREAQSPYLNYKFQEPTAPAEPGTAFFNKKTQMWEDRKPKNPRRVAGAKAGAETKRRKAVARELEQSFKEGKVTKAMTSEVPGTYAGRMEHINKAVANGSLQQQYVERLHEDPGTPRNWTRLWAVSATVLLVILGAIMLCGCVWGWS